MEKIIGTSSFISQLCPGASCKWQVLKYFD